MPGLRIRTLASLALITSFACAVPEAAEDQLRTYAEQLHRLSDPSWGMFEDDEFPQMQYERWLKNIHPELIEQLEAGTLVEDGSPHDPTFDDTWWPQGLADIGVTRPETLDERVREPWEYANEMQRLIWETQDPEPGAADRWIDIRNLLLSAGEAHWRTLGRFYDDAEEQRVDFGQAFDTAENRLIRWITHQEAAEAFAETPELLDYADQALAEIDEGMSSWCAQVLRWDGPGVYAVHVPPSIGSAGNGGPYLIRKHTVMSYLLGRAHDALLDGDVRSAADDYRVAAAIAEAHAHTPNTLGRTVYTSRLQALMSRSMHALHAVPLDSGELDALESAILAIDPPPFIYCLEGERLISLAMIDESYASVRASYPESKALRSSLQELSREFGAYSTRGLQHHLCDLLYRAYITRYDESALPEKRERAGVIIDLMMSKEGSDAWGGRTPIIAMVVPAIDRAYQRDKAATARHQAMRVLFAIERYRIEHDRLPETLEALEQRDDLDLTDPYSDAAPFGYIIDDPDAGPEAGFGVGYRLYSVGADGEDNGGNAKDGRQFGVLSPVPDALGFDYVFNRPSQAR